MGAFNCDVSAPLTVTSLGCTLYHVSLVPYFSVDGFTFVVSLLRVAILQKYRRHIAYLGFILMELWVAEHMHDLGYKMDFTNIVGILPPRTTEKHFSSTLVYIKSIKILFNGHLVI